MNVIESNQETAQEIRIEPIGARSVSTSELTPNPHNPRYLFDKAPLNVLKESIGKVGILVPLTVYWDLARQRYIILDGQRRWITAQAIGLTEVPINQVAEPSLVQNIVTMFQIHKLREDWELMPTALKLEVLMTQLKERSEPKLAALTGLDPAVVSRCKKLLSYPKKFQDLMLEPEPENRIKADFFIELYAIVTDRFVNSLEWFERIQFTSQMLEKYLDPSSAIKAVTDFRLMKQYISNAHKANQDEVISERLREFANDVPLKLDHLRIEEADLSASTRQMLSSIKTLEETLSGLDEQQYYGEEDFWNSLERLGGTIQKKLIAAGRRPKA